jgi:hypothetical protein
MTAQAQGSIAGVVRDTSGAVLPGVTVEASSPVLIEKVRSVITDGAGQYRIVDLRPGTYSVVFTLPGFSTLKRDGIELSGSFTANVNADLRVGALEETVTVTGEAPTVDVQGTTRQRVLEREVLDTIPTGRSMNTYAVLIPGMRMQDGNAEQDIGGSSGVAYGANSFGIHGGRNTEQQIARNGLPTGGNAVSGYTNPIPLNPVATQEVNIDTAAASGEYSMGGVRINMIPREGGNTFRGTVFANYANPSWQADNMTPELLEQGVDAPDRLRKMYDFNPGFGGPIKQDSIWFFVAARKFENSNYVAGMYYDKNFNNPNVWTYDPDLNRPAYNAGRNTGGQIRFTWQATPKNKFGMSWSEDKVTYQPTDASSTRTPESATYRNYPLQQQIQVDWNSPLTSRLLLEAGANRYRAASNLNTIPGLSPLMIPVTEQSTGLVYRAFTGDRAGPTTTLHVRAAASYITGTHSYKVGMDHTSGNQPFANTNPQSLEYRFNNGVPNRLTMRAYPIIRQTDVPHRLGLFAQDKWTVGRLTANYGLRYDYVTAGFPEQHLGPGVFAPTRDLTFPEAYGVLSWHDMTPHLGAAYDLFGTGKTAFKVSLNKYVENVAAGHEIANGPNPVNKIVTATTRSWNDANRNYVPDCDLLNPVSNGECGTMSNTNFAKPIPRETYDDELMKGWGKRGFDWEFSAGVQHELFSRTSLDVSYFRRWYGNFRVYDNRALSAGDFDEFDVRAPLDSRLPDGGGYVVPGMLDLNPAKFGIPSDYLVTRASNYGDQTEYWQGVDVIFSTRSQTGLLVQAGTSTGRTVRDNCEIVANVPEPRETLSGATGAITVGALIPRTYCHVVTNWLTQFKGLASYTIPRVDVLVSGTVQSLPGDEIQANYNVPTAVAAQSLGRPLSGGAANTALNLVRPGTLFGPRLNQLDLRFGKVLRFGRIRSTVSADLYNAFNGSTVLRQNGAFGPAWLQPTLVLPARLVKFAVQLDF